MAWGSSWPWWVGGAIDSAVDDKIRLLNKPSAVEQVSVERFGFHLSLSSPLICQIGLQLVLSVLPKYQHIYHSTTANLRQITLDGLPWSERQ